MLGSYFLLHGSERHLHRDAGKTEKVLLKYRKIGYNTIYGL